MNEIFGFLLFCDIPWAMGDPKGHLTPNYKKSFRWIKACLCIYKPAKVDSRVVSDFILELEHYGP